MNWFHTFLSFIHIVVMKSIFVFVALLAVGMPDNSTNSFPFANSHLPVSPSSCWSLHPYSHWGPGLVARERNRRFLSLWCQYLHRYALSIPFLHSSQAESGVMVTRIPTSSSPSSWTPPRYITLLAHLSSSGSKPPWRLVPRSTSSSPSTTMVSCMAISVPSMPSLYPNEFTNHTVASSSWRDGKGDVVKEFTDSCRHLGISRMLPSCPRCHALFLPLPLGS